VRAVRPLDQIASGGELSRIMLALKTVLADKDEIETLIFDEIDTGISGRTAWKVSEKLGVLAKGTSDYLYHSSAADRSDGRYAFPD
jgi:DNA repair protein RecN (Recombination protein N)